MKYLFALLMGLTLLFSPAISQAETTKSFSEIFNTQLKATGTQVYGSSLGNQNIISMVSNLISVALSLIAVLLLGLTIYAGFLWMTAGGDAKQVQKAKDFLVNAVIGLVLIIASYAITSFVLDLVVNGAPGGTSAPSGEVDLLAD